MINRPTLLCMLCLSLALMSLPAHALDLHRVVSELQSDQKQVQIVDSKSCLSATSSIMAKYAGFKLGSNEARWMYGSHRQALALAKDVNATSFQLKQMIKAQFSRSAEQLSGRCINQLRRAISAIRSLEDRITERAVVAQIMRSMPGRSRYNRWTRDQLEAWAFRELIGKPYPKNKDFRGYSYQATIPFFEKDELTLQANSKGKVGLSLLQSGDLVISRGGSSVSAAIARIGQEEGDYSHTFIIYIPEASEPGYEECKKGCLIESLIETGVHVKADLKKQFSNYGAAHLTAIRFLGDQEVAKKAAREVYLMARQHQKEKGKNVCYDPNLDDKDPSCMYCSEVVMWAYHKGSGGRVELPYQATSIRGSAPDFIRQAEIKEQDTFFAPSDLEVDPRFQTVAEWRNPEGLLNVRLWNSIFDGIYQAQEASQAMSFVPTKKDKRLGKTIIQLRDGGLWSKILPKQIARQLPSALRLIMKDKISESFTAQQMGTIIALDRLAEAVYNEVFELNEKYLVETGRQMTASQLDNAVKTVINRHQDLRNQGRNNDINRRLHF